MTRQPSRKRFGVYFDATKSTSGQRFYGALCDALSKEAVALENFPAAVLFNVSAPIGAILKAKLRRQKVAVRIDGLYLDKLSPRFLATFRWPLRTLLKLGLKYERAHDALAHLANFFNQNYAGFARMVLADWVIYQSDFCKRVHARYFPNLPCTVIVNGAAYQESSPPKLATSDTAAIRLITINDDFRTAKRVHDLVAFIKWVNSATAHTVHLTILGYRGQVAACAREETKETIEHAPYIRTLPRFTAFTGEVREALMSADAYITFTYRDPCPNAVVESMAHGLPVVALASGGMPDIVGDAGILLPVDDFADGYFSSFYFSCDFPPIDYEKVLEAVLTVVAQRDVYRVRVKERFRTELGIDATAARYTAAMRALAEC